MSEIKQPSSDSPPVRPAGHHSPPKATKPRKPPPVTPRRFRKFFTPVALSRPQIRIGTSRRALQRITNPGGIGQVPTGLACIGDDGNDEGVMNGGRSTMTKKRKRSLISSEPLVLSSPLKSESVFAPSSQEEHEQRICVKKGSERISLSYLSEEDESGEESGQEDGEGYNALRQFYSISQSSSLLASRISSSRRKQQPKRDVDRRYETASFYSGAEDTYYCGSPGKPNLPFCSASCNTNSLVAVGDEQGEVRILETASESPNDFAQAYLRFKPHDNAIMDLDFSDDDLYLATGSGDQTCQIIDMMTQQILQTLSGHCASIKAIRFRPQSNNSVLASCGRDGTVNIWDLRRKNVEGAAQMLCHAPAHLSAGSLRDSIHGAHGPRGGTTANTRNIASHDFTSVTDLMFLGQGREHLMVTSSEGNAALKVWDMRMSYGNRRSRPPPVSTTRQPGSHERHRQYGLTSMALSSDSGRVYTLCRDHTVYVYSTSHLVMGHAPELGVDSRRPRRAGGAEREGAAPLYGFRHQRLDISTFYSKLAIRQRKSDQTEILAAGSGNKCAVVFPTNEANLPPRSFSQSWFPPRPTLKPRRDEPMEEPMPGADLPIYQHGTALIRGHSAEVTSCSWTSEGQLVTLSDDNHVRRWREGDEARALRRAGEGRGRRWRSGWAEAEASYDDDGGDDDDNDEER